MSKRGLAESAGVFYMGKDLKFSTDDDSFDIEKQIKKAKMEKEAKEAQEMLLEAMKGKQRELDEKLQTLEGLPTGNKVLIMPYPTNPYKKIMEGSIIVDYTGDFNNPDSGEKDTLKQGIACGKVIEVGPEVKYIREGDDVYYDTRTIYPIPFMSLGYWQTSEPSILFVVNEKLKERFNSMK